MHEERHKQVADDTKTEGVIGSDNDATVQQEELNGLYEWSNKWMMHFNTDECSVLSEEKIHPLL